MQEYGQGYYMKPPTFAFTMKTTGINETFTLPIYNGGSYNFNVVWGDGNGDDITAWDDAAVTHTYASAGTYEIKITGTITGWRFANAGDKTKIYNISSWGSLNLGNLNGYFHGCTNLTITATDILDLTGTRDLQSMFQSCSSLVTVPSMNSWDVSAVTSLRSMFLLATAFNQDISSWDTSEVRFMLNMFDRAAAFNQDIGGWDTSYVAYISLMFSNASSFNRDISSWDISGVSNLRYMFRGAVAFNQDIGGWDTSAVTNMEHMFDGATSFDQDIGGWDIASITNMIDMFKNVILSTANYDSLLVGWEAQAVQNDVIFSGGNSQYTAAPSDAATA